MTAHHNDPQHLPPTRGYRHVIRTHGDLVFVSGQVPLDAAGNLVGGDDPSAQTEQVFRNIGVALEVAGAAMTDVVRLTIYLVDLHDLPAVRAARDQHIDTRQPPTSSLVQVAGLVDPSFRVEIDAIAVVAT
jgi:enamine deaminase RidA (YjgF/YER057c/UK114 family)